MKREKKEIVFILRSCCSGTGPGASGSYVHGKMQDARMAFDGFEVETEKGEGNSCPQDGSSIVIEIWTHLKHSGFPHPFSCFQIV